jgi:Holliday junction resolvasome RuvABC endonuclease subunit
MTTLLSFDPSSTRCGWSYWQSIAGRNPQPHSLGVIAPPVRLPSDGRIDLIVEGVLDLARRFLPSHVVLEYALGKVAGRLAGRKVSGLAVLGQAQGRVYQALADAARHRTSRFDPEEIVKTGEEWTGGVPKEKRSRLLVFTCPIYCDFAAQDPGFDAADAVLMGWEWIARHKIEATTGGVK